VATQDRWRQRALHVPDKANGFAGHDRTVNALADMLAAAGLRHPEEPPEPPFCEASNWRRHPSITVCPP